MNRKQLITIVILAVILGGLGIHFFNAQKDSYQTTDAKMGQKLLPEFPINDVAHIQIKQGTNQLNLVKQEDAWKVRERYNYPANFSEIGDFLRKMWDLKTVQSVAVGPSQLGRLELNSSDTATNSGTLVDFKDKTDKSLKSLMLGKKYVKESAGGASPYGGGDFPVGRYVMVVETSPKVWIVSDALTSIEPKADQWLNKDFFKIEKIKAVSVTHTNATNSWKLTRDTETADFKLEEAKPNEQLDTPKASGAGHALSSPSFTDVLPADAKPEQTGMDKAIVATLDTFDDFNYTIKLAKAGADENYNLNMTVNAIFPKERPPGKDEKPADKDKLDKEFKEKIKKLEDKLKQEKQYEKWVYVVGKWSVDPLLKERKDLLAEKKEEPPKSADTNAPPQLPPSIEKFLQNPAPLPKP